MGRLGRDDGILGADSCNLISIYQAICRGGLLYALLSQFARMIAWLSGSSRFGVCTDTRREKKTTCMMNSTWIGCRDVSLELSLSTTAHRGVPLADFPIALSTILDGTWQDILR